MHKSFFLVLLCLGLLTAPAWASMKSIGKDNVNIRSGPGLDKAVIFNAPLGYPIKIEKQMGSWIFFRDWEGDTGWVYNPLVSDVKTVVVLVDKANVRNSPGTKSNVVTNAAKGEIYKILAKKNGWIKIGYFFDNKPIGWIRKDLVFGD